ncbi:FGGY family carbohydrate kinase [Psychromarinibacter sp. S121]|uniref:FGGY family carbohydrate kinase n=1 Tax=Psychromarinibacter sp. S121 TaxID=3415127 RepID=UPI003C7DB550
MEEPRNIAVFDIGRTNAKLVLVDLATLSEIAVESRPNKVRPGPPWPHFDTEALWQFLLDGLARMQAEHGVHGIVPVAHGACGALVASDGSLAAPVMVYDDPIPSAAAAAYDALRPPQHQTGSPRLDAGLNLGAQFHWQLTQDPSLKARTAHALGWPQYWAFRLTGVTGSEPTSLGAHTDLWNSRTNRPSPLAGYLGLTLPPVRDCHEILGPILPGVAAQTGLNADTPVLCGIHDSDASLFPYLVTRKPPFAVVSTGTWIVAMAPGANAPDTAQINTDALGRPLPAAMFPGGRTYAEMAGPPPSATDLADTLAKSIMLLPGPRWHLTEPPETSPHRTAAASFALAIETADTLARLGHAGPVFVEGAFARNTAWLAMLAACGHNVAAVPSATGTSAGAACLFRPDDVPPPAGQPVTPLQGAERYIAEWRRLASSSV